MIVYWTRPRHIADAASDSIKTKIAIKVRRPQRKKIKKKNNRKKISIDMNSSYIPSYSG